MGTDAPRINASLVHSAAVAVAGVVWSIMANGAPIPDSTQPSSWWESRVQDMTTCLGEDTSCDLFLNYWPAQSGWWGSSRTDMRKSCPQPCTPNWYAGVIGGAWNSTLSHMSWLHDYLISALDKRDASQAEPCNMTGIASAGTCAKGSYCISTRNTSADGIHDGVCQNASVYFHPTYSIGIFTSNSTQYYGLDPTTVTPVWAESTWGTQWGTRLYSTDSAGHEAALLGGGILTTALAFA